MKRDFNSDKIKLCPSLIGMHHISSQVTLRAENKYMMTGYKHLRVK
jgi:hypothetical protein